MEQQQQLQRIGGTVSTSSHDGLVLVRDPFCPAHRPGLHAEAERGHRDEELRGREERLPRGGGGQARREMQGARGSERDHERGTRASRRHP